MVRPFFRDHFARLDRQIVLVDALAAFNAGPAALRDLEDALAAILDCFRTGRRSFVSSIFRPRIDRILFAATKADHLHHINHDRLERILARMIGKAIARAEFAGATVDVVALAAVRATREAMVARSRDVLPSIVGYPVAGETVAGETADVETFDGDDRGGDVSRRPAGRPGSAVRRRRRDLHRARRCATRLPVPALPSRRDRSPAPAERPPCPTSASTVRCNSCLGDYLA